jgi:SAM-dependent methyltransferase
MDAEFDAHADEYDQLIGRGLMLAGERKEYFAERRVAWMAPLLARYGVAPGVVLDYGCGTGAAIPSLLGDLGAGRVVGLDVSTRSLELARRTIGDDPRVSLTTSTTSRPPTARPPSTTSTGGSAPAVSWHSGSTTAGIRGRRPWSGGSRSIGTRC